MRGLFGVTIGDVIGSYYEGPKHSTKEYDFELFNKGMRVTDDTIHTLAIADWLMNTDRSVESCKNKLIEWSGHYLLAGFGPMMRSWIMGKNNFEPYNSFGNGSGMRVVSVAYVAKSLEECLELAEKSALPTHNHPEGIKGAKAIASAAFLNKIGKSKEEIKKLYFIRIWI